MKLIFNCFIYFLAAFSFISNVQAQTSSGSIEEKVGEYLKPYLLNKDFSGTVLIAKGDRVLFKNGYGMADYELNVPNAPKTKFRIASITKTFTAAAVAMLREEGKLSLNDKLSKFIPDFPNGERITVEHLLLHRSGVQNPDYKKLAGQTATIEEVIETFKHKPLNFEPGTKGQYSNAGYVLLAYVVEKASGMSWENFLKKRIFIPLKMNDTGVADDRPIVKNQAKGYQPGAGESGVVNAPPQNMSGSTGSGSLYSTVEDLYAWARAVNEEKLFKRSSLSYPYGWGKRNYFEREAIEQSGLTAGFTSILQVYLNEGLYVVVLSNIESAGFNKWGKDLAAIALGEKYAPVNVRQAVKLSPQTLENFTGEFKDEQGRRVEIFSDSENLYLSFENGSKRYLQPVGEREFFMPAEFAEIKFGASEAGSISHLNWSYGEDKGIRFVRQNGLQKKAIPTRVLVRAVANDAKLIFDKVGGAKITIKDAASGKSLAEGIQKGTSGDTNLIMVEPRKRGAKIFDTEGAAGFTATLDLEKPTLVEISAEGPLKYQQAMQRASKTVLLVPGRDILGEGIILELHGFIVDFATQPPEQTATGQTLDITATAMMLCSCPLESGGLWDADKVQVTARLVRADGTVEEEIPLKYAGQQNTFAGKLNADTQGEFKLQILATDAAKANFGMIEKPLTVK